MGLRFYQNMVAEHEGFQGVVEAAMMLGAYKVLIEDVDYPNHVQRRSVAVTLFQGMPGEVQRYLRLFTWRAVFDPTIQQQVFDASTGTVTPERIDDDDIDRVIWEFWDEAALATEQDMGGELPIEELPPDEEPPVDEEPPTEEPPAEEPPVEEPPIDDPENPELPDDGGDGSP